ncbi:hypothetical protein [Litchfieldia alkalitelluris]|uniref:hypothetical protein n=1 Tax=Litchfieldia alkalitelluris TaxID=304268 RepID=UPI00099831E6|nr:hypothetical protein [Litchfieldia alkalitelluris]
MQFNRYKDNVSRYIDDYYESLAKEISQRPESSYPIIFEEELSTMKRYSHSLFKEVLFEMQDVLEQTFSEDKVQDKLNEVKKMTEQAQIQPISYIPSEDKQKSLLVKTGVEKKVVKDTSLSHYKTPTISGCVLGATIGGLVGKTLSISALGALSGGVLAYTATYYYIQRNFSQKQKKYEFVNKPQNETQNIGAVIERRKDQVKKNLISTLENIENRFFRI